MLTEKCLLFVRIEYNSKVVICFSETLFLA